MVTEDCGCACVMPDCGCIPPAPEWAIAAVASGDDSSINSGGTAEAQRVQARAVLTEAAHTGDVDRIRAAIESGRAAELTAGELAEAHVVLAEAELAEAVTRRDTDALRAAIEGGRTAQLSAGELAEAQTVLQEEERVQARVKIADAVRAGAVDRIRAAIDEGEKVGVDGFVLQEARRVEKDVIARQGISGATSGLDSLGSDGTALTSDGRTVAPAVALILCQGLGEFQCRDQCEWKNSQCVIKAKPEESFQSRLTQAPTYISPLSAATETGDSEAATDVEKVGLRISIAVIILSMLVCGGFIVYCAKTGMESYKVHEEEDDASPIQKGSRAETRPPVLSQCYMNSHQEKTAVCTSPVERISLPVPVARSGDVYSDKGSSRSGASSRSASAPPQNSEKRPSNYSSASSASAARRATSQGAISNSSRNSSKNTAQAARRSGKHLLPML